MVEGRKSSLEYRRRGLCCKRRESGVERTGLWRLVVGAGLGFVGGGGCVDFGGFGYEEEEGSGELNCGEEKGRGEFGLWGGVAVSCCIG